MNSIMSEEKENHKLIEQLNRLPKIEDPQSKSILFTKVNQSMEGEKMTRKERQKRKQFKWVAPSFAMIVTAILIVFMVQSGVFNQEDSADHFAESQDEMRRIDHQEHKTFSGTPDVTEDDITDNIVYENEAFRIYEPAPNSEVDNEFSVRGQARIFEASVNYEFEDGHFILDEGVVMASEGAPEWGEFEITIRFDELSNDHGTVILYEASAKDGSRLHELMIPVKHNKGVEETDAETNTLMAGNHLVYYSGEYDFPLYNIGVMDMQGMYAIPITLVDTSATGFGYPNDVYNRLSTFIDEDDFGVYEYPYDEIEFIISDDLHEITMKVADDFIFPDTSTQMVALVNTLNLMFADYPATEINLETETKDYIELGQIGVEETLPLEPVKNLAYKIYQYEDKERLLIPIPYTVTTEQFYTIDEALLEMKYDQEEFDITGTIPAHIDYTLDPSNQDILRLTFESDPVFGDNQMTKEMIESILFTAKSFGFNHVEFDLGEDVTQVNQFDLSAPVSIPDGINPILLH